MNIIRDCCALITNATRDFGKIFQIALALAARAILA